MLKNEERFKDTEMNELHRELLIKCLDHDLYWIDHLIGGHSPRNGITYHYEAFISCSSE